MPDSVAIAVIIPVFNGADTIGETLDSVLAQTWTDWEIIVVNDGSTDGTDCFLQSYQQCHPELGDRFRVLSFENAGVSQSRNRGIATARGEYIAFLDADDLWIPEKLEHQWQALQDHPTAAVAYSFTAFIDENGKSLKEKITRRCNGQVYEALLMHNFMASGSNPLVKRSALDAVGGFAPELSQAEDWDLWLRLARVFPFVCVPTVQVFYRKRLVSASSNIDAMNRQSLQVIQRELNSHDTVLPPGFREKVLSNRCQYLMFKSIEPPLTRAKGWLCLGFLIRVLRYDPGFLRRGKTIAIVIAKILLAFVWPKAMKTHHKFRVLLVPADCSKNTSNPYHLLLRDALIQQGAIVDTWSYCEGKLPIYKAAVTRGKHFDIIHLQWLVGYLHGQNRLTYLFFCLKFLLDIALVRLSGFKIIWTIHDYLSPDCGFPAVQLWTRRQLVKMVNRIICLNSSTIQTVSQGYHFSTKKAVFIPHGHYRDLYPDLVDRDTAREALGLPKTGKLYLSLGYLKPYKGLENLLCIWNDNQTIFRDDTLLIAGKSGDENYVELLRQLASKASNVIFSPQFIENSKIHCYYCAADVIVLPYKQILNSGSVFLAMSFGKPVIAPAIGGVREALGSATALLYDPEDPKGLVTAMKKSSEIDLSILGQLVIEACDRLSWSEIAKQTIETYQSVLYD